MTNEARDRGVFVYPSRMDHGVDVMPFADGLAKPTYGTGDPLRPRSDPKEEYHTGREGFLSGLGRVRAGIVPTESGTYTLMVTIKKVGIITKDPPTIVGHIDEERVEADPEFLDDAGQLIGFRNFRRTDGSQHTFQNGFDPKEVAQTVRIRFEEIPQPA